MCILNRMKGWLHDWFDKSLNSCSSICGASTVWSAISFHTHWSISLPPTPQDETLACFFQSACAQPARHAAIRVHTNSRGRMPTISQTATWDMGSLYLAAWQRLHSAKALEIPSSDNIYCRGNRWRTNSWLGRSRHGWHGHLWGKDHALHHCCRCASADSGITNEPSTGVARKWEMQAPSRCIKFNAS